MKRTKAAGCALALVIMAGQVLTALATEPGDRHSGECAGSGGKRGNGQNAGRDGGKYRPSGGDPDIGSFRSADGGIYRPGHL